MTDIARLLRRLACATALALLAPALSAQPRAAAPRSGDYIIAVVNQEVVTAAELEQRLEKIRVDAARARAPLPPEPVLRRQVLDALIDERVQVSNARESGYKVDEAELDRAVGNVALQNQLTLPQLREKLQQEGIPYAKFRANVRDQIMSERVRERDVMGRIKVSDADIDALLAERRAAAGLAPQLNIEQILVTVPEGASDAVVAERRARIEAALARIRAGESFEAVAREVSEDANRAEGGAMGLRPADRLPDVFVNAVRALKPGEMTATPLRTGAGFHLLKLVDRQEPAAFTIQQTHARHILLRTSPQLTQDAALRRMADIKRTIASGAKSFEQAARENSEDASAAQGGDLGWVSPGAFVPEFEEVLNALPAGGISEPIVSRFGVHLVQVLERREVTLDVKQQREQARNILRERKFETAYLDWIRDLRGRAYIEMREPPG
ncbi:MAG: peptidylprolyl isomerase [Pseudomonadota bacterium]|nr:peptidylprolyl isomerase [Pseudomonadota bacterium]